MARHEKAGGPDAVATVQRYAKAITAGVGAVLTSGAVVLPDNIAPWVALGMAALTGIATATVRNRPPTDSSSDDVTSAGYPDADKWEPPDALGPRSLL
jgi:hypothetical protein